MWKHTGARRSQLHFCYLDETGCTGADLGTPQQPVFVIGGICVKDQGWRVTTDQIMTACDDFFGGQRPENFELHAHELINGAGPFEGRSREERNAFVHTILDILDQRSHWVHFVGIDKQKLAQKAQGTEHGKFDARIPYLLGFNYMVSYLEKFARDYLAHSGRSMIILDTKDMYHEDIDRITHARRFEIPKSRRLTWLVEFSYPVDSVSGPKRIE